MDEEIARYALTVAALETPSRWLEWLNQRPLGGQGPSKTWLAARRLGEAAAGRRVAAHEARSVSALLGPFLKEAWETVFPYLEGRQGDGKIEPKVWFSDIVGQDARLRQIGPEPFYLLAFFVWLWSRSCGPGLESLRKCGLRACEKFFIDSSRAQKAKFCSSSCRSKSFRAR